MLLWTVPATAVELPIPIVVVSVNSPDGDGGSSSNNGSVVAQLSHLGRAEHSSQQRSGAAGGHAPCCFGGGGGGGEQLPSQTTDFNNFKSETTSTAGLVKQRTVVELSRGVSVRWDDRGAPSFLAARDDQK